MTDAQTLFTQWAQPGEQTYAIHEDGVPLFRFTIRPLSYHAWNAVVSEVTPPDPMKFPKFDPVTNKPVPNLESKGYRAARAAFEDEIVFRRILHSLAKLEFWVSEEWQEVTIPGETVEERVEFLRGTRRKLVDAIIRVLEASAVGSARRIDAFQETFRDERV